MINVTGSLDSVLEAVADYLKLSADNLKAFAVQDTHTGWDFDKGDWPVGSLHRAEGQVLYAIARATEATKVVECGALQGCSSTHLAQAMHDSDEGGKITSVDILEGTGQGVPSDLSELVKHVHTPAQTYFTKLKNGSLDMIYEDTDHTVELTRDIWLAAVPKVKKGGVIVSHDAAHELVGAAVIQGVSEALESDDFLVVKIPPADCGLLVWVKP